MGEWIKCEDGLPDPFEEVLVWVDGNRSPGFRNNHHLVAYLDPIRDVWWEERHSDCGPLNGVICWAPLLPPPEAKP